MTLFSLLALYIAFRLKHFTCDFLLQTDWMALNKGLPGWQGYKALLSHAALHGGGTLLIALIFMPSLWWLGIADFVVHGLADRAKGLLTRWRGWTDRDRWYWWSFGLDQEVHNYTHLAYIVLILVWSGGLLL